ncbi:beta-glucosidase 24-like protein [Trifolium pratense]|uniref:Beta-glucosidase 24-like protein n=1 Tax=Trifolium pratense TaxID=57577 RepID=A0A2K3NCF5_TRIPR|nr:beta-glucosidase 24-like protein [Trifolium pratense]
MAPGRCSSWFNPNCTGGDSGTEPYLVSHYQLLAHAAAVNVYKTKYQVSQNGLIGITLIINWFVPLSNNKLNQKAAERAIEFMFGWFMDPLTNGDYPKTMRALVGTSYASDAPQLRNANSSYLTDSLSLPSYVRDGKSIGINVASDWLYVYPRGIRDFLIYAKEKYNNPLIYITENGINEYDDPSLSVEESLLDTYRVDYHYRHLFYLREAIKAGVNVKGYFAWSLLDNFEWHKGYTWRWKLLSDGDELWKRVVVARYGVGVLGNARSDVNGARGRA